MLKVIRNFEKSLKMSNFEGKNEKICITNVVYLNARTFKVVANSIVGSLA